MFFISYCSPLCTAQAFVRTTLATKGDIWVGQRVTIVVELLSPGFFSGTPVFDLPHVPGVVLIKPDERPGLNTETIDGASYAVQRHELAVFPQRAGRIEIPAFTVRFSTREGAAPAAEQRLKTRPVSFEAKLPPGAEGLTALISAQNLEAKESWQPEPGAAKVGDAFTRTVTFTAPDVPAMLFPPFPATQLAGLGVYRKAPQVRDRNDDGQQIGERIETITYVCERPGQIRLPAVKLTWWDLDDRQLKTIEFQARVFNISSNPALASLLAQPPKPVNASEMLRAIIGFGLGVLLLIAMVWWVRPRWSNWWQTIVVFWKPVHLAPLNPTAVRGCQLSAKGAGAEKCFSRVSLFRANRTERREKP